MLHQPTYDPLRGIHLAGPRTTVNFGWLQTPDMFAENCRALTKRPSFDSWALATQMTDSDVRILESPLVPNFATVALVSSPIGIEYPVVALQAAALQVRFLLTLANPATQDWLRAVTRAGVIHISLEVPETKQVAVVKMRCNLQAGLDVEELIGTCAAVDCEQFERDAVQAVRNLSRLDAIPSLIAGFHTQELRLVVVLGTGPDYELPTAEAKARVLN